MKYAVLKVSPLVHIRTILMLEEKKRNTKLETAQINT